MSAASQQTQATIAQQREDLERSITEIKKKYEEEARPFWEQLVALRARCYHPNQKFEDSFYGCPTLACPDCGRSKIVE